MGQLSGWEGGFAPALRRLSSIINKTMHLWSPDIKLKVQMISIR